jgi:hypothetical protein
MVRNTQPRSKKGPTYTRHEHNKIPCPHCGKTHELSTAIDGGRGPKSGDISLCIDCGNWAVYVVGMGHVMQRIPNGKEWEEINNSIPARQLKRAWQETSDIMRARKGLKPTKRFSSKG